MRVDLQSTKNGTSAKLLIFKSRCEYCRRRVAVLYGGEIFACRPCHNLTYPCQRKSADDRARRRADKIRARPDWEPGILNGKGLKPKGVHWRTYRRLSAERDRICKACANWRSRSFWAACLPVKSIGVTAISPRPMDVASNRSAPHHRIPLCCTRSTMSISALSLPA
jgi:hypothetical protein